MTVCRPDTGQRRLFFDYSQKGFIARVCQNVVALRLKEEPNFHCLHEDAELSYSLWFSELFLPEVSQLFAKLTQTPFKIFFFFSKIFLNSLYPYQSRLSFISYGLMNENNNCRELSFLNQRHFSILQHPLETVHHPQLENVCSSFNPCAFNL